MVAPLVITAAVGAASILISAFLGGVHDFAPGACERLEPFLLSEIVGQDLAIYQACDAICDHLKAEEPQKPLVLSVHGPPGVGKSMMHLLMARALYNKRPSDDLSCPGSACLGYKVLYGMDYTASEREQQHELLLAAVLDHIRFHPHSLLVIEEYDKLDCRTRGLLKQLIDSSQSTNATINKSIILLESNTGFPQLHQMLVQAGSRAQVTAESAQRMLKDLMFTVWAEGSCESATDTVKLLSLMDFYLPFLPLERDHIRQLTRMRLRERQAEVLKATGDTLTWSEEVIEFLTAKVDFDGPYPIEGAKEVKTLMTRYVTRALRVWSRLRKQRVEQRKAEHKASGSKKKLKAMPAQELPLRVSRDAKELEITA